MVCELYRRDVLRLIVAGAAVTVLPARVRATPATVSGPRFLTSDEFAILDAAIARIIPTDSQPGARECGAAQYIQNLLSFMPGDDANCDRGVNAADLTATVLGTQAHRPGCPLGGDVNGDGVVDAGDTVRAAAAVFDARPMYGGGPFSGRQPQPHFPIGTTPCHVCHIAPLQQTSGQGSGAATTVDAYPPDYFEQFLQPSRLQALAWKIRILGATAVPEAADNPLASASPEADLRRKYRDGLAALESMSRAQFGVSFVALSAAQQTTILNAADPDFVTLLTTHTIEGMLCAPEYGGNRDRLGWQLVRFDGDSQPLGYEIYDETVSGNYRQRPDKPDSGPNPDEDCSGFSTGVNHFLTVISGASLTQPGRKFSSPYCFGVDK